MIRIKCTNCQAVLEMDDAFAGGACRCKHCGTIQTVPSPRRQPVKTGVADPAASRTLYENRARIDSSSGTGLDQLADVVASSSGLTSSRLRRPDEPRFTTQQLVLVSTGAAIVILLAVVVWLLLRSSGVVQPMVTQAATAPKPSPQAPVKVDPNFCGIPLDVPTVIYVLDRGNSSREVLGAVKEATLKSIESLGRDRRFQIIFWSNGSDESFPSGAPLYATAENLSGARKWIEDIAAFGQSDVRSAVKRAAATHAPAMVLITPKGWELDRSFTDNVRTDLGSSKMIVHTIAVGDTPSAALKSLSEQTGGQYRTIDASALREFAQ